MILILLLQDNYTLAQPGIQYKVKALKDLIKRIDGLSNYDILINYLFIVLFISITGFSSHE